MTARGRRVLKWAGALGALAAIALLVSWHCWRGSQPVYQGRPLLAWVKELQSVNPQERERAVAAVRSLGTNALPTLVRVVARRDSVFRRPLLASQETLPRALWWPLYRLVRPHEAEYERQLAIEALGLLGPQAEPALPVLAAAVDDPQPRISVAATDALAHIGKAAVPVLLKAMRNPQELNRSVAYAALARLGPEAAEAVPALLEALTEEESSLRSWAIIALARIGPPAIPPLLKLLADGQQARRGPVIEALARIGSASYEGNLALLAASPDASAEVRAGVIEALAQATPAGPRTVLALSEALADPVSQVRLRAAETLGALAGSTRFITNALPALQLRLQDDDEAVRQAAAQAMRAIGESTAGARPNRAASKP
jgi:HEAT repeat protein